MFRYTGFAAIATAAVLLAACDRKSDGPTAPPAIHPPLLSAPARDTVRGIVKNVMLDDTTRSIKLTTADGLVYNLVGPNAAAAATVDGVELWVSGEFQNSTDLYVENFEIRSGDASACQDQLIVDMPPNCLSQIEKLNPHRAHLGNAVRPR